MFETAFLFLFKGLFFKCLHDMCFHGLEVIKPDTPGTLAVLLHNDPHNTAYLFSSAYIIKC